MIFDVFLLIFVVSQTAKFAEVIFFKVFDYKIECITGFLNLVFKQIELLPNFFGIRFSIFVIRLFVS